AMTVFFRDIMHIWTVFTTALLYFSAIFYDPAAMGAWLQNLIKINPLYWYITAFRYVVLDGKMLTLNMVLVCSGCAILSLVVGLSVFRSKQDKFVLYI
ncbi:MAG: ABC transporter permease, partial [Oscillospiraceae bacterium]